MLTLNPGPNAVTSGPGSRMTLIEHLDDLRRVLIISLAAWALASILGVVASGVVIDLLVRPLKYLARSNPDAAKLHYFGLFGYFSIRLKVGLVVGLGLHLVKTFAHRCPPGP